MEDLTFGEQVKIILSRKGMTIKELAELIEASTGKKMSRQNLTQRLGRDNFQEQDMRRIAKILGCPFQLSIFPLENEAGEKAEPMEELLLKYVKHPKVQPKRKKENLDDGFYQQVLVFDQESPETAAEPERKEEAVVRPDTDGRTSAEEMTPGGEAELTPEDAGSEEPSAGEVSADSGVETKEGMYDEESSAGDVSADGAEETEAMPAGSSAPSAEETDFDDGEDLLELDILDPEDSEDLDEADLLYGGFKTKRIDRKAILAAAEKAEKEKWDAVTGTVSSTGEDSGAKEQDSDADPEAANSAGADGGAKEQTQDADTESMDGMESYYGTEEQTQDADTESMDGTEPYYGTEDQAQDSGTNVGAVKETAAAEERDMTIGELYMIHKELDELEETIRPNRDADMVSPVQEVPTVPANPVSAVRQEEIEEEPEPEDFEPVIRYEDAEENLELGEMNPYTGREYQTNSVRMHPTRIGYVQVYDRFQHGWTDMTEWAFLGYQERKKTLLGRDYEPPIYLD